MTRFQLLKALRCWIEDNCDVESIWMPRGRNGAGYKELWVWMWNGRRFVITIEEDRWTE